MTYISGHKVDDFEYHNINTRNLFKNVFNKDTSIGFRKDEQTLFIRFSDKVIFEKFHELGMAVGVKYDHLTIPGYIKDSERLMFAFIRGVVDTDGCVVLSKQHRGVPYYPRIEVASKSHTFLLEILSFLREKGFYGSISIKPQQKSQHFRLEIPGKKNLVVWMEKIGFNNPKHKRKAEAIAGLLRPWADSKSTDFNNPLPTPRSLILLEKQE